MIARKIQDDQNEASDAQHNLPGAANLAAGYLITPEFSSTGGTLTETASKMEGGKRRINKTVQHDDPELHQRVNSLINQGRRVLRHWCAPALAGLYFCPVEDFAGFDEEMDSLRLESYALNHASRLIRSDRRTVIEVFPFPVDVTNLRVALRIGQTMHESLVRLKESITDADATFQWNTEWRLAKNLYKLVTGSQHTIVYEALRGMDEQRRMYGARTDVSAWDFQAIDAAIALFAPSQGAFVDDPSG